MSDTEGQSQVETPEILPSSHPTPNIGVEDVQFRLLEENEVDLLQPLFEKIGWADAMPDPAYSKIIVAEAGKGKNVLILGFSVVQFLCHVEPMWIRPDTRGTGLAEALSHATVEYVERESKVKRYVCVAKPGSFSARLAESVGMRPIPGQVYVKQTK
jgi:hypothetical protein